MMTNEHEKLMWFIHDNPTGIVNRLNGGQKIPALKELRRISGCGLKEAKYALDAWERGERPRKSELDSVSAAWIVRNMIGQSLSMTNIEKEALKKLSDEIIG